MEFPSGALTFEDTTELCPDIRHYSKQFLIGIRRFTGIELQDGHYLVPCKNRKRESAANDDVVG